MLAPHLGSATRETRTAMADLAVRNVIAVAARAPAADAGILTPLQSRPPQPALAARPDRRRHAPARRAPSTASRSRRSRRSRRTSRTIAFQVLIATMLSAQTRDAGDARRLDAAVPRRAHAAHDGEADGQADRAPDLPGQLLPEQGGAREGGVRADPDALRRPGARHDGGAADAAGRRPEDREPGADPRAPQRARTSASTPTSTASRTGWAGWRPARPRKPSRRSTRSSSRKWWPLMNLYLVTWGQNVCRPVYPLCGSCVVADLCPRIGVEQDRQSARRDRGYRRQRSEGVDETDDRQSPRCSLAIVTIPVRSFGTASRAARRRSRRRRVRSSSSRRSKGTIEFETYPGRRAEDRRADPRAREEELLQRPALPSRREQRLVQIGDPVSRDMSREACWGQRGSGNVDRRGGDHQAPQARARHGGDGARRRSRSSPTASSTSPRRRRPSSTASTPIFGRVTNGLDVVAQA